MKLTKTEIRDLKAYGYDTNKIQPCKRNAEISHIIVISHGNRRKHDSGYPFIKIIGVGKKDELYNLGWHDHIVSYVPTNTDSLGKNIFRIAPWLEMKWKLYENFISVSSFMIGNISYNPKEVILR